MAAGDEGNKEPDPKTDPPDPKNDPKNDPDNLGPAGLKALQAERARADKAEADAKTAREEAEALKAKNLTAEEKAIADAKKEGRSEALLEANRKIVRSEIRAACAGRVSDPEDAALLLGDLDRFIRKDEVDSKAISEAISDLVKAKPYLAPAGKARPLPGGGATPPAGGSLNDEIRRKIRGG